MTDVTRMLPAKTPTALFAAVCSCLAALALAGAAPNRPHGALQTSAVTLNLSRYSKVARLDAGPYAGVSPGRLVIHAGDAVVFANTDSRHHTATGIPDATAFPSDTPRWTDQALKASSSIGPGAWSTGDLAPGQRSAPMIARTPGTYLYGCFYDYSAGMRGEIVVEP
jgi:plastocyanin